MSVMENTPAAWSDRALMSETSWEAAGWSQTSQNARFQQVVEALNPQPGETLYDFGCGTGELTTYLQGDIGYTGFDSAQGMVDRAAREHPGHHFQTWEPRHTFDLVAAVGPFNLTDHWSKQMTFATLRRLWDMTGRAMCVSLYAGTDPRCLVYSEQECARFASGESYWWHVDRWRPNDILVTMDRHPRERVF